MNDQEFNRALLVCNLARQELAACLQVVQAGLDFAESQNAAETWIETLDECEWPQESYSRFFRQITILTFAKLTRHLAAHNAALTQQDSFTLRPTEILKEEEVYARAS